MATLTRRDTTAASTVDGTSYASASFTPVAGELLVVGVRVSASVLASPPLTASANGMTFTLVSRILTNASVHMDLVYVSNQLVPGSPVAMTVTLNMTGDAATGAIIGVIGVGGMTKVGTAAVRQAVGTDNNHAASGTPALTLTSTSLAGNPLLGFVGNLTSGGVTPPSGWTELLDLTYATPSIGYEVAGLAAGAAVSSVTWGGSSGAGGVQVVELDASAGATVTGTAAGTQAGAGAATGLRKVLGTAARAGAGVASAVALRIVPATAARAQAGASSAVGTVTTPSGTVTGTAAGTQAGTAAAVGRRIVRATAAAVGAGMSAATALRKVTGTAAATGSGTGTAVAVRTTYGTAAGVQEGYASAVEAAYVNPYGRVPIPDPGPRVALDAAEARVPVGAAEARIPTP